MEISIYVTQGEAAWLFALIVFLFVCHYKGIKEWILSHEIRRKK